MDVASTFLPKNTHQEEKNAILAFRGFIFTGIKFPKFHSFCLNLQNFWERSICRKSYPLFAKRFMLFIIIYYDILNVQGTYFSAKKEPDKKKIHT